MEFGSRDVCSCGRRKASGETLEHQVAERARPVTLRYAPELQEQYGRTLAVAPRPQNDWCNCYDNMTSEERTDYARAMFG